MTTVSWYGEDFEIADEVPDLLLDEFLCALSDGAMGEVRAARTALLKAIIGPERWKQFRKLGVDNGASNERMFEVLGEALAAKSGRPTERPSDSSDGSPTTADSSTVSSSQRVIGREEAKGRPDRALMVLQASGRATA